MQGQTYTTDMLSILLESYSMILGVQWLMTLGNILWNFGKLRMHFKKQGVDHILLGNSRRKLRLLH